jgi:hypothetical protein
MHLKKPGKKHGRVVFPVHKAPLRTHASFVNQEDAGFHVRESILVQFKQFDMIKDDVLDYMHVVCLGSMRKLLQFWVKRDTRLHLITNACLMRTSKN